MSLNIILWITNTSPTELIIDLDGYNIIYDTFKTLRPEQNGQQFANIIFLKLHLFKGKFSLNLILLKLDPSGPVDYMSDLVQGKTVTNQDLNQWLWYVDMSVQCQSP